MSNKFDPFEAFKKAMEENLSNAMEQLRKDVEADSDKAQEEEPMEEKKKPSAGLSAKQKSAVVKKAEKGEDIGKKGKGFEKVAAKAAKEYGSEEIGKKVAAAALWKSIKR